MFDTANNLNTFMAGEAQNQYLQNLPNYAGMINQQSNNISQQLKGQLPQDVIDQIGQQAAERGISNGMTGGQNTNSAYLRALGLNSLQMQQTGAQNLAQVRADTPVSPLFNPATFMVPDYFGNKELGAARMGMQSGRGFGGANITGMPQVGIGSRGFSPSNYDVQQGMFNSPTFTNGMFTGRGGVQPNQVNNWWGNYGGRDLNSNISLPNQTNLGPDTGGGYDWGGNSGFGYGQSPTWDQWQTGADHGQFADEDVYTSGQIDASDPNQWKYFE